jgi:DNA replication and repair protein RecF
MADMELRSLSLVNFRNFASLDLELPSGLVVLVGDNAQGKSNLLEAVYLLAIAKSYRVSSERDLVSWRAVEEGGLALVAGTVARQHDVLEIRVGMQVDPSPKTEGLVRKQIRVNGVPRRASEMVGLLNAVLFSAEDLEIVYGAPAERRRYLDVMLCQVSRPYLRSLQRYQHVVAQRNSLLRRIREGRAQVVELEFWDQAFCTEGAHLLSARYQAVASLAPRVQEMYRRLMGADQELSLEYVTTTPLPDGTGTEGFREAIARGLEASRPQERAQAQTVVGPHRDDLRIAVAGVEMAGSASRGQARLAALALRLAEGELLRDRRGEPPVILLDDVLSELDVKRRALVMAEVQRYPQVFVTTVSSDLLPTLCWKAATHFRVSNGQVTKEENGLGRGP